MKTLFVQVQISKIKYS